MAIEQLKILAIDDNRDNLITLKAVLSDLIPNASVVTALTGLRGIELALSENPDVILLDIVMPGMDGYEVCRTIKQDERLRLIPVIFLTSQKTDRSSRIRALDAGAEAFLSKPLDEIELVAQVRSMAKIKSMNLLLRQEKEDLASLVARRTSELEHELTKRHRVEQDLVQLNAELEKRVKERTAELQGANAALQRASRLKDEFLANMSHELRTPLTGILGLAEILQEGIYGEINPKQVEALGNIRESGQHLLSLINDILDLSKVEAGKIELNLAPVNLGNLVSTCLRMVRQAAQKKHLTLSNKLDPTIDIVMADERLLKQILVNLLSNAVKFTPEGGTIGIDLAGDGDRRVMHLEVWDTGIGISREDQALLFKPFVQLDGSLSRQHEGTGLGLALVYRLVEQQNGSIELQSQPGEGSRFTVTLPWQKVEFPDPNPAQPGVLKVNPPLRLQTSGQEISLPPMDGSGQRILVAEDNLVTLAMLSDFLQASGYHVIQAHSGTEVFLRLQESLCDLVLLDIQMPLMNGIQVLQQMRSISSMASIPVIALTAQAMPGDHQRCLEAGANEYLSKPLNLEDLRLMLKKYLKA